MRNIDCLNIFDLITVIYRISVIDTRKIVKGIVEFIFYLDIIRCVILSKLAYF